MNRIKDTFEKCEAENRKAFVAYVTMGCPDLNSSEKLVAEVIDAGADIIELGVPFSDPMADGKVIQESARRALEAGTDLKGILKTAANIRDKYDNPLVLFSYYNVILSYGVEKLAADAAKAGIDALLVVDLPFEHEDELAPSLEANGLCQIPLIAPTTSIERARNIISNAKGFVYCITSRGVTGGGRDFDADLEVRMRQIHDASPVPVVAGFGIDTPEKAAALSKFSDGIVVGSAIMKKLNECSDADSGITEAAKLTASIAHALKA